ncbi:6829_t:CDS:2 [Funneliformis geosporum]|uniref:6829_t:CDS:1 n=1 Tax=Funneliformis geosporum TaxID=1117311 RepID=A0A9W4SAY7_9GLOM|nr:6829_t:CDS:2 [Funneliformis geosporum]
MVIAQTWLDRNIPLNQRNNIEELHVFPSEIESDEAHHILYQNRPNRHYIPLASSLTGKLNLSTFPRLRTLNINKQFINRLVLTNCNRLRIVAKDLSEFNRFRKLTSLFLGTERPERINQGVYNRWNGSLSNISNLTKLEELDINATDVNDGLIDLPTRKLRHFTFGDCGRTEAEVNRLKDTLSNYIELEGEELEK